MADMHELIERLEAATRPDREIDAAIYTCRYKPAFPDETEEARIERARVCAPHYTASIDQALTLLPAEEIALLDLTISWEPNDTNVHAAASVRWYPPRKSGHDWNAQTAGGRTPALAICIAAIRARATLTHTEKDVG